MVELCEHAVGQTERDGACHVAELDGSLVEKNGFGNVSIAPHDGSEIVLLAVRPHFSFCVVYGGVPAVALLLTLALLLWSAPLTGAQLRAVALVGAMPSACLIGWTLLEQRSRLYVLTDRRVIRRAGVLCPVQQEIPLAEICRANASLAWKFGPVGTVLFWSEASLRASQQADSKAMSDGQASLPRDVVENAGKIAPPALCWEYVPDPVGVSARVSDAVRRYGRRELP